MSPLTTGIESGYEQPLPRQTYAPLFPHYTNHLSEEKKVPAARINLCTKRHLNRSRLATGEALMKLKRSADKVQTEQRAKSASKL